MDSSANQTTVTATTAGTALGGIVGWVIAAATGVDTAPIAVPLCVLGGFIFGIQFPGK